MSRNAKIALAVIGGLVAVCCLGAVILLLVAPAALTSIFGGAVSSSPEEAASTGQEIATYTLPAGYQEQGALDLFGTKMVAITGDSGDTTLILMQFSSAVGSEEQMREQIQQSWGQQTGQSGTNMQLIEERPITVRDQSTTLTIMEGTDQNGNTVRQAFTSFTGENGIVMFMAAGNADSFDQEAVDDFLESIR
jgi:hypothetical protein